MTEKVVGTLLTSLGQAEWPKFPENSGNNHNLAFGREAKFAKNQVSLSFSGIWASGELKS